MSGYCPQLVALLAVAKTVPAEDLPRLLGDLEEIRATAMARLAAPAPTQPQDELLDAGEAARRLGLSVDYLYHHHKNFPFSQRIGRRLLFSSRGIEQFISQKKGLEAKRVAGL